MKKSKMIERVVAKLNSVESQRDMAVKRRERLQKLVDVHGWDDTAAAAGLTVNTLNCYLRSRWPKVSEKKVAQAEYVLETVAA